MSELNRFKKEINLSEFAAARGYALDKRESSRSCAVMRHPNGEKIIVARNEESGDWVYFVIGNYQDNGTIIDFLQNRRGGSLGEVRKTLRDWLGSPRPQSLPVFARELLPISRDRVAVRVAWEAAKECAGLPSLTSRGLKPALFVTPRFKGCLRKDDRSNALFPHYDRDGLCGFEVKNRGFTGFAPGGIKGLWLSQVFSSDRVLVLTESAIDALSFHVLHGGEESRYMSTGGEMNPQQPRLLRGAMEKMPEGSLIVLGFDHDAAGEKLAEEVAALAPSGREVRRMLPDVGKDWNDALKNKLGLN